MNGLKTLGRRIIEQFLRADAGAVAVEFGGVVMILPAITIGFSELARLEQDAYKNQAYANAALQIVSTTPLRLSLFDLYKVRVMVSRMDPRGTLFDYAKNSHLTVSRIDFTPVTPSPRDPSAPKYKATVVWSWSSFLPSPSTPMAFDPGLNPRRCVGSTVTPRPSDASPTPDTLPAYLFATGGSIIAIEAYGLTQPSFNFLGNRVSVATAYGTTRRTDRLDVDPTPDTISAWRAEPEVSAAANPHRAGDCYSPRPRVRPSDIRRRDD